MKHLVKCMSVFMVILVIVTIMIPGCKKNPASNGLVFGTTAPASGTLRFSKAPTVNEQVQLSFTIVITKEFKGNITKMWLQFDRFDPSIMYPLDKIANAKEQAIAQLSKLIPTDASYQALAENILKQPETKVEAKILAGSGPTEWAVAELTPWEPLINTTSVSFPETGEWLITGYWEVDGQKLLHAQLQLTVNENDGQIGWQKDYSHASPPYFIPQSNYPVGLRVDLDRAPGLGEEAAFICTLTTIQDTLTAQLKPTLYHMVGTTQVEIPVAEYLVNGEINWKGELKAGIPTDVKITLKFPLTGDYYLMFTVFPQIQNVGGNGVDICFSVGEKSGRMGWVENHSIGSANNPIPTVKPSEY